MDEIYKYFTLEEIKQKWPPYIGQDLATRTIDITGKRFGSLTAIYRTEDEFYGGKNRHTYVFKCDCGNYIKRSKDNLKLTTKSCNHCKTFTFCTKIKEKDGFDILEHFIKDEGKASILHTVIKCKNCGYTYAPRTTDVINKKLHCRICEKAEKTGLYIGYKHDFLEIIGMHAEGGGLSGTIIWDCKCNRCGTLCRKTTTEFKRQHSCGCLKGEPVINSIGQTFGRLTVLELLPKKHTNENQRALCQCECGGYTITAVENLRQGHTLSCGCLQKEKTGFQNRLELHCGEQYGDLTVLEFDGIDSNKHTKWKCRCKCGTVRSYLGYLLTSGAVHSCGCVRSKGEEKISQILIEHNISFIKEKTFDTCRFSDSGALAKFDFYVNNDYLIEFDGIQHFKFRQNADGTKSWNNEDNFNKTKEHDEYKNLWCKQNNITLIRIPYIILSDLNINDLQPNTSQYVFYQNIKEYT